jgi:hypothetical protein
MGSAAGARSGSGIPGLARPGATGSTFRQLWKECKHGNEEKSEEGRQEEARQEGQEEEGRKTASSSEEETSEEEAGFTQEEARKEKGGPQGRQEKSCEETRQEEGETRSGGQASGEIHGAGNDGSTCCAVGCGGTRGKNCPESRCCLAVPDRVTALGGSRIVCGRALCRQSPNRRHSVLELPVPGFRQQDGAILPAAQWWGRGPFRPKFFYCAPQHELHHKSLIRHRFSAA